MEKVLKLYNSQGAFPSAENQIEILGFNYDAKRMGGAPIITATVMYGSCLDAVWTADVYVELNREKYYLKQTPTSSFSNTDARYKHECEFVSERIKLDNVYFIDAVVGNPNDDEKPVSNSATFSFFGTIVEFAKRLNAALQYSKLQTIKDDGTIDGYYVEMGNLVDLDGKPYENEEKLLSFDKIPFSTAIQEAYNQFGIPYYFEGKRIIFDYFQHDIKDTTFKYGYNNELLSITKNNANQKIINRCTGTGSEENIPYYYPNEHPLGIVDTYYTKSGGDNKELRNDLVVNNQKFGAKVKNGTRLTYTENEIGNLVSSLEIYNYETYFEYTKTYGNPNSFWFWFTITDFIYNDIYKLPRKSELGSYKAFNPLSEKITFTEENRRVSIKVKFNYLLEKLNVDTVIDIIANLTFPSNRITYTKKVYIPVFNQSDKTTILFVEPDQYTPLNKQNMGSFDYVYVVFEIGDNVRFDRSTLSRSAELKLTATTKDPFYYYAWKNESDKIVQLENYGLAFNGEPIVGAKFTFQTREGSLLPYQNTLMPPIYIETKGEERYYNAVNDAYKDEGGVYYEFDNLYSDNRRKEHIVEFPDIKPSIENVKNDSDKEYINSFIDIKFDDNDNDETYEEEGGGSLKYLHPYFYVKLRKFDGKYGFNLFTHASEQGEMTISMTSGDCGACNFVIGVDEDTKKNILQVDEKGNLVWDEEKGMPKFGDPQERQNDTQNNEVWLALKKDIETYSHIMPSGSLKPAVGDTFVITNISFPTVYLRQAEERLKEEIIKFMYENNMEKFTFSIKFSRIYLEEHPEVLSKLNENSLIKIEYNGEEKTLYVNSFAYKKDANTALPEITVELAETLSASQNALQTAISQVKTDVLDRVQKMDIAAMVAAKFISKDTEDYAMQKITFNRGFNIGTQDDTKARFDELGNADIISQVVRQYISTPQFVDGFAGSGFKLWLDENGKSNLTIDNLTARETFRVFEMLVTKLRAVNGGLFISAANGTIKDVVEGNDYYDIVLENDNTFIAGDFMRCQVMSGLQTMNYWVEISYAQGNICRVLKSEFNDAIPVVGQEVVLDGSRNVNRQNAIHISASEDGQPRIAIYNGIKPIEVNGVKSISHNGCLRTQLGDLNNIQDKVLNPQGDGLYSDNAYLKGEFILKNSGKSAETVFEIQDGKIKGGIAQTQSEAIRGKSFLYNASFIKGLEGWLTSNTDSTYFSGTSLLFASGSMLAQSVFVSNEPIYDNVFFVNIKNGWIKQSNLSFINKPVFDSTKEYPLFFSTNIRCNESGVLNVYLTNIEASNANTFIGYSDGEYFEGDYIHVNIPNNTSYVLQLSEFGSIAQGDKIAVKVGEEPQLFNLTNGQEIPITDWRDEQVEVDDVKLAEPCNIICVKRVGASDAFKSIDLDGLSWNGQGDFYLSFSGDADFYGLTIYTEKTEVRHKTFFDMSDRLISFGAQQLNTDGSIRQESGIVVQPEGAGLYAKDENGNQSRIAAYSDGKVVLEGNEIQLKGNLTTDGKFKVREDGSIEATNGSFSGYLINKPLKVTEENYREFFVDYNDDYTTAWAWKGWLLCSCVILKYTSADKNGSAYYTALTLPSVDANTVGATQEQLDTIRSFIGQSITVYNDNDTNKTRIDYHDRTGSTKQLTLDARTFASFVCKVNVDTNGTELVYWEKQAAGNIRTTQ